MIRLQMLPGVLLNLDHAKTTLIERVQEVVRDYYDDNLSLHRIKFAQLTTRVILQPEQN